MATATTNKSASDKPPLKRRRTALSCHDCRRRNLQCDRIYPACGRCVKGDHADSCTYDTAGVRVVTTGTGADAGASGSGLGSVSSEDGKDEIMAVREMERLLADLQTPVASSRVEAEAPAGFYCDVCFRGLAACQVGAAGEAYRGA